MIQFSVTYPVGMSDDEIRANVRLLGLGALEWEDEELVFAGTTTANRLALIECPEEMWAELEREGYLELGNDDVCLEAEMP